MHRINDVIIENGKIVLSNLPFADGQHVRIVVAENDVPTQKRSMQEVRSLLKGGVDRYDDPFEPIIADDSWEMLK